MGAGARLPVELTDVCRRRCGWASGCVAVGPRQRLPLARVKSQRMLAPDNGSSSIMRIHDTCWRLTAVAPRTHQVTTKACSWGVSSCGTHTTTAASPTQYCIKESYEIA